MGKPFADSCFLVQFIGNGTFPINSCFLVQFRGKGGEMPYGNGMILGPQGQENW